MSDEPAYEPSYDPRYAYAQPHYAGWAPAPPRPRTEGLAIASFVTSLVGLGLVPIGLGIAALVRIRRLGTSGRWMAWVGIVLGTLEVLAALAFAAVLVVVWQQTRPLPADVSSATTAHAGQLVVGNCLGELPPDGDVTDVRVVPCDEPHEARVVSTYAFGDDDVWPGQPQADARVARSCVLSADEEAAGAAIVTWAPTEAGWELGDRTGLCLVVGD